MERHMDIDEANLRRLRAFGLDIVQDVVRAANSIAQVAEDLDVALCKAEEEIVPEDELYNSRGERVRTSILKEISRGCRKADRASADMNIGQLIGYMIYCAKQLAIYAEQVERELESKKKQGA